MTQPIALVTGGSRGIGAAISKKLAHNGFHVVINFTKNETKAQAVLDEIIQNKGSASLSQFDVSCETEVDKAFKSIAEKGKLEVLINNAGITVDSLLLRLKSEDLNKTLDVDLKGAIYCSRAATKLMMKNRSGSIIQISSVIAECGNPGQSAYAAAKSGLIGFSKSIAKELSSRNIRVNVITPGYIATDMTQALTDTQKEAIVRQIPLGFLGQPEDIANMVGFLVSQESRYITGQTIGINGGMYM